MLTYQKIRVGFTSWKKTHALRKNRLIEICMGLEKGCPSLFPLETNAKKGWEQTFSNPIHLTRPKPNFTFSIGHSDYLSVC